MQAVKLGHLMEAAQRSLYWRGALANNPVNGLPVLTKSVVREQGERMLTGDASRRGVQWCCTGGTTGEPLRVAQDAGTRAAVTAGRLRGLEWLRIMPGDATVLVRGFERVSFRGELRCLLGNFRLVDPLSGGHKQARDGIWLIRRFKPRCLIGYPTSLLKLAEAADGQQVDVPVILCTGEMLYPFQRERLQSVFNAKVAEYYGSNEVGSLAFECEHGGKHVTEEHVLLETVDEQGHPVWEQPGRIVVTDLDNHIMPLIRYELGDLGTLTREPCVCGRPQLVLRELEGRRQDVLRNARGDILPAMFFAEKSRHLRGIRAYQLVQRDLNEIVLGYVADNPAASVEAEGIRRAILQHLGADMRIRLESRTEILLTPRGKTRLVVGLD
jgi:phenylacetate-CoA ligase